MRHDRERRDASRAPGDPSFETRSERNIRRSRRVKEDGDNEPNGRKPRRDFELCQLKAHTCKSSSLPDSSPGSRKVRRPILHHRREHLPRPMQFHHRLGIVVMDAQDGSTASRQNIVPVIAMGNGGADHSGYHIHYALRPCTLMFFLIWTKGDEIEISANSSLDS